MMCSWWSVFQVIVSNLLYCRTIILIIKRGKHADFQWLKLNNNSTLCLCAEIYIYKKALQPAGKSTVSLPMTAKLQHFDCSHISISPPLTLRFLPDLVTIYYAVMFTVKINLSNLTPTFFHVVPHSGKHEIYKIKKGLVLRWHWKLLLNCLLRDSLWFSFIIISWRYFG